MSEKLQWRREILEDMSLSRDIFRTKIAARYGTVQLLHKPRKGKEGSQMLILAYRGEEGYIRESKLI